MECTLKLRAVASTLESRTVIQRKADRLEKWADKNLSQFRKGKCRVPYLAWHNPTQQYKLGSNS